MASFSDIDRINGILSGEEDWPDKAGMKEILRDLVYDHIRLSDLVNSLVNFRRSKEHKQFMSALNELMPKSDAKDHL